MKRDLNFAIRTSTIAIATILVMSGVNGCRTSSQAGELNEIPTPVSFETSTPTPLPIVTPAPVSQPVPTPAPVAEPSTPEADIMIEAEDLTLVGYRVNSHASASGGRLVRLASNATPGTLNYQFEGDMAQYDVSVTHYDENDGRAVYDVFINDLLVGSHIADENLGEDSIGSANRTVFEVADITIGPGDSVRLEVTPDQQEWGRVDRIDFRYAVAQSQTPPVPTDPPSLSSPPPDSPVESSDPAPQTPPEPDATPTPTSIVDGPDTAMGGNETGTLDGVGQVDFQPDTSYPQVREEIFTVDFDNLPDNWVGQAIDEEMARMIFLDPFDLHEYSLVQNGSKNRGFGGTCPNGKDVIFLDQSPEQGKMMCVRHCAEEKIEENFLHMHWADDGEPSNDRIAAEWDFIVPECMGDNRNCTAVWGGKLAGLGHGYGGGGKGDECGINSVGWRKGYPGGSEAAFHGMSYRVMWHNPDLIDSDFRRNSYVGINEACTVRKGFDAGELLNLSMYIYYWKAKRSNSGGRDGSVVSMCSLPKAGEWTRMTQAIDPANNHFQAWINGDLAAGHTAPATQSCGGVTKDPVQGVSGFFMGNFFGGGEPTGTYATPEQVMCFDNIKVYKTF